MLRSLRNQLVLSHVLPSLIIIPLMGIALIWVIETHFLLPRLGKELTSNARLVAEVGRANPSIWEDPAYAQFVLGRLKLDPAIRVMLFNADGLLVYSSHPNDSDRLNQYFDNPGITQALQGEEILVMNVYNERLASDVVDIFEPAVNLNNQIVGIIRLTYQYSDVYDILLEMRFLIASVLFVSMLAGIALGSLLAVNISVPIRKATQVIYDLAHGEKTENLSEYGADEIRWLFRAVNYLLERLHSLEQARRQLLANLIHELGRPLGALRSAIQALAQGAADDPELLEELTRGMDQQTIRLQRLLEDLSHLHEQVLGSLELERQPVVLTEWLTNLAHPWQEAASEKRLHWEMDLPHDLPTVQIDPLRLSQVIENLISNAIKYTPAGGMVKISARADETHFQVTVSDTGPGIPPEEQEEIFKPYYRGSRERRFPQGMGLGLTIVQDLVQAHGGTVILESTPGFGSHFTIRIPLKISYFPAPESVP